MADKNFFRPLYGIGLFEFANDKFKFRFVISDPKNSEMQIFVKNDNNNLDLTF